MADNKAKLNTKAKPFNPNAASFVPFSVANKPAAPGPAPIPAPVNPAQNSPTPSPPLPNTPVSAPPGTTLQRSTTGSQSYAHSQCALEPVVSIDERESWEDTAPASNVPKLAPAPIHADHKAPTPSDVGLPAPTPSPTKEHPAPVTVLAIPVSSPPPEENIDLNDPELRQELQEIAAEESEIGKKPSKKKGAAEEFKVHDSREHLNIVFIGHVDAGKSTVSGQILLQTGQVDERTIQKYEREAKEKGRDSWYLAFIMDTNEEERAKGKTVEVGRAHFDTKNKRYTLLDAPGHKNYVPNMIGGVVQADVGILIISARKGEFETGFERGGQTREHAMLAKTMGVHKLIVAVNKMDESTVNWNQQRFNQIVDSLGPYLRKCGYKPTDLTFVPISGYTGANLKDPVSEALCPWLNPRKSLLQILDDLAPIPRDENGPLRIPIIARYKDMGVVVALGKIECGSLQRGQKLFMVPNNKEVECVGIDVDDEEVNLAKPGENVNIKLKGIEEEEIQTGFVLGDNKRRPAAAMAVEAQLMILDLLEHKPIVTAGYLCVFHVHSTIMECQITKLVAEMDPKTGKKTKRPPTFVRSGGVVIAKICFDQSIAVETFKDVPQLGRFTLRDEGKTIAIGKVTKLFDKSDVKKDDEDGKDG